MLNEKINQVEKQLFDTTSAERFNNTLRYTVQEAREKGLNLLRKYAAEEESPLNNSDYAKITELGDFMEKYVKEVGKEVAIAHLQTGLNLITDYRKDSLIPELVRLEEDSIFGEKTMRKLLYVLRHYSIDIIKHYIRLGILNNIIEQANKFEDLDTDTVVTYMDSKLTERRI